MGMEVPNFVVDDDIIEETFEQSRADRIISLTPKCRINFDHGTTVMSRAIATGDVNGDNMVNIFDLVIAAGNFGKVGADIMGDVNADGNVNIFDLVMVAGNFGKTAAAPMLLADPLSARQLSDLARGSNPHRLQQAVIALAQQPDSQIAVQTLKQVLSVMQKPENTQLRQNYPGCVLAW